MPRAGGRCGWWRSMAVPSDSIPTTDADFERVLQSLTDVLLGVARGDFGVRAHRSYQGDAVDVLAFLVNSTAEEVGELVRQLNEERSALKETRDQLLLAAKLASLGELAAGVAHELNQPLTAIRMLVDLLVARPEASVADCLPDLETLAEAARRMARIVEGVRMFGRAAPIRIRPVPALAPVEGALELIQETLERHGIEVERQFAQPLPAVRADEDRLYQVFVNLLTNARDALAEAPAGARVVVGVEAVGDRVVYRVEDNGPGIDEAIAQRIFDPFFTTKAVGRGTGLGLSLSHGIVAEHGGELRYEPAPGGGARFVFELRACPSAEEAG